MLAELKERVWKANLGLVKYNLVILTWGNVSGIDWSQGLVVIKPSGVSYEELKPADMVVVDLKGKKIEGKLNASSDTPTHIELYKAFKNISGIAHTHSEHATMFAQAYKAIPCLGTTHADYFHGEIPVTRLIRKEEAEKDYEANTGKVIVERFAKLNPLEMPAVLVAGHGPFTWGRTPEEAVINSVALESVAKMAWGTLHLSRQKRPLPEFLLRKHYQRRHGPQAYYGQKKGESK